MMSWKVVGGKEKDLGIKRKTCVILRRFCHNKIVSKGDTDMTISLLFCPMVRDALRCGFRLLTMTHHCSNLQTSSLV